MRTDGLSFETANGPATAYVAMPAADATRAVLVIQEYWGLNDHIKDICGRYADEGFIAIAPDLYVNREVNGLPGDKGQMRPRWSRIVTLGSTPSA